MFATHMLQRVAEGPLQLGQPLPRGCPLGDMKGVCFT